jgi:hypothetical protein
MNQVSHGASRLDRIGIVASTLCAIHCAGSALLVGASALVGFLRDERTELGFVGASLAVAGSSLLPGFFRHRARAPLALFGPAAALLAAARLLEWEGFVESALSLSGAAILVGAHVANLRACRRASRCSCSRSPEGCSAHRTVV